MEDKISVVLVMSDNVSKDYQKELDSKPEMRLNHFDFVDHGFNVETKSQYYIWFVDTFESAINDFVYKFVRKEPLSDFLYYTLKDMHVDYQLGLYTDNSFGLVGSYA